MALTQAEDLVCHLMAFPAEPIDRIRVLPPQVQGIHRPGPPALVAAKVGALTARPAEA